MVPFRRLPALVATLLLGLSLPLQAATTDWTTVTEEVAQGENETVEAAKQRVLNNARRRAVEERSGVDVRGSTVMLNQQIVEDLVSALSRGSVVEERPPRFSTHLDHGQILHRVTLSARVVTHPPRRHGSFSVQATTNRPAYHVGDPVQVAITASQPCFVAVFNVDSAGQVGVLVPSRLIAERRLGAGQTLRLPPPDQPALSIRAELPPNADHAVEYVKVIVTRNDVDLVGQQFRTNDDTPAPSQGTGLISDLLKGLAALEPADWAETTVPIRIQR